LINKRLTTEQQSSDCRQEWSAVNR